MIDSHCHLSYISEKKDVLLNVLKNAKDCGVKYIIDIGVHPDDIDKRIVLLDGVENIFFTAGFYPDYAESYNDNEIVSLKNKVLELNRETKKICVIGEIGLDYYHNSENKKQQCEFFEKLIVMSNELDLPISIHTRDAWDDTISMLEKCEAKHRGVIHCFSGGLYEAKRVLDLGYLISFSGVITYPKNGELRDVAKYVPSDMYTLETDAPYLTPQKVRGKKNEPAFIKYIAEVIAAERNTSLDMVMNEACKNAFDKLNI